jgi:hypothetical protein
VASSKRSGRAAAGCALVVALLAGAGCSKPTSESIQTWKTTQKGPERLKDAVGDKSIPARLRAEATVAMVDIGRAEEAEAVIGPLPAEERFEIVKVLIPLDEVAMKDPSPEKALGFRDALFSLRQFGAPDDKARIDAILLPAIEKDLKTGRLRNGRHSIDKMLTAIGPPAGAMLAEVLAEPTAAYQLAADLLGRVGDDASREKGAAKLVARAKKEKPVPVGLWRAIGTVGGPSAIAFLELRSQEPNREEAVLAVRALKERRDPAVLPLALKVAGDARADKLVRDEMFGVIEGIGGGEAQRGLLAIISSDKEELVRYRAFEVVITANKTEGIIPALEAFPAAGSYKKIDVDDLLVKLIEKLGPPARPVLVKALESRAPLARMTAVMTLEQIGKAPDAPALEKLAKDSTTLKGFPAGETIGKAAVRVAEIVKKKV